MPKLEKTTTELIKEFFVSIGLQGEKIFKRQELYDWFKKNYPDAKRFTLYGHLVKLSVNSPSRKWNYVRADGSDDILFQITGTDTYKLYNEKTDVMIKDPPPNEPPDEGEGQEISILEKELQNILVKNLSIIESGLKLFEDEENGRNGLEYPVDGRFIDILALDKNNNFVVIELKVSRGYDRVVGQLLRYKNWIKEKYG